MTWTHIVKLHELDRGPLQVRLEPDDATRAALAKELSLRALTKFRADVTVKPWLDGVELTGRFKAVVEQVCGVTLEPFEQAVDGEIDIRAVPVGSALASSPEGREVELDPEGPDAPDVLDGDSIDVAAYAVEHLALEIDPFPRKPGATFEYQAPEAELSPFAALKALKADKP